MQDHFRVWIKGNNQRSSPRFFRFGRKFAANELVAQMQTVKIADRDK
jgi:hypothetical protein